MTNVTSGTTTERILRTLLLSVLVDVFAVMFLWDGYIGYPRKNVAEFMKMMGVASDAAVVVHSGFSAEEGRRLAAELRPGIDPSSLTDRLGVASLQQSDAMYFLGPGGWLKVETKNGRVHSASWSNAAHPESDMQWQRWIGYALCAFGLLTTVQLARVLSTRATVSEKGLALSGRPLIAWEAITDIRRPDSGKSGIVELIREQNGAPDTVLLDDYVYKDLPGVVAAICEQKGLPNPLRS